MTDPQPGGDTGAGARAVAARAVRNPQRVGVELRVGLATLLGRDQRPGELPGWGPILPEVARALVARQRRAAWRFAVAGDGGRLLLAGLTRPHTPRSDQAAGGIVELHLTATELAALAAAPAAHPEWAALIADLAAQYARRDQLHAALDARPDARLVRGALLRHIQIRDRTCIAPGCRRPATRTDTDHTIPVAAGGATVAANTGPLCGRHHALKHDGGWQLEQPEPGLFCWTSPLGQSYTVRGEPIMPPLPEPLPRPPTDEPPAPPLPDPDTPTFDPRRPAAPAEGRGPPGRPGPLRWHLPGADPTDPAPF